MSRPSRPSLSSSHIITTRRQGLIEQAIPYWQKARRRASQRSANVEAISHLSQGAGTCSRPCPTRLNAASERLGWPRNRPGRGAGAATKGYASPEARPACAQGRELCEQTGTTLSSSRSFAVWPMVGLSGGRGIQDWAYGWPDGPLLGLSGPPPASSGFLPVSPLYIFSDEHVLSWRARCRPRMNEERKVGSLSTRTAKAASNVTRQ